MKKINGIVTFIIFLEEFFFWSPGRINTLIEKILMTIFRSGEASSSANMLITLINPALCWLLLLMSATSIVRFVFSIINENLEAEILLLFERYSWVRIVLIAILVIILLSQLLNIFNDSSLTLISIYQNKMFWAVIFVYMIIKRILSEDNVVVKVLE